MAMDSVIETIEDIINSYIFRTTANNWRIIAPVVGILGRQLLTLKEVNNART